MKYLKSINKHYVLGYLMTLLLGSLHFGKISFNNSGYDIGTYSTFENMFIKMFNWENDIKKHGILIIYIEFWSRIMTTLLPIGGTISAFCTVPLVICIYHYQ